MSTSQTESELSQAAESLSLPTSSPPAMNQLTGLVRRRRRQRVIVRRSALGAAVVVCFALVFTSSSRRKNNIPPTNTPVASDIPSASDLPVASPPIMVAQQEDASSESQLPSSTMRLYARVRGQVPVFEVDRDAQRVQHVGWIDSEHMVPVDMRYVPSQQQETFNAVLRQQVSPLSL